MSQKIINFIANLPHFHNDRIDDKFVATRLTDGTIYLTPDEPLAQEEGLIVIWWQGKKDNQTIVCGAQIAKLEIVEAVRYYVATGEFENLKDSVNFLFEHFQHKTGVNLYHFNEEESVLKKLAIPVAKGLGVEVVKKLAGF